MIFKKIPPRFYHLDKQEKPMKTKLLLIIINKLFCSHEWFIHGTGYATNLMVTQLIICKKCGKIKKITY